MARLQVAGYARRPSGRELKGLQPHSLPHIFLMIAVDDDVNIIYLRCL